MSEEKPLHVAVAEVLGWRVIGLCPDYHHEPHHIGYRVGEREGIYPASTVPRYDTDWSATGPLIERFGIWLRPGNHIPWVAQAANMTQGARTPLEAICWLIVNLHGYGKLDKEGLKSENPVG